MGISTLEYTIAKCMPYPTNLPVYLLMGRVDGVGVSESRDTHRATMGCMGVGPSVAQAYCNR